jgi:alpha-glucosidase
MAKPQTRYMPNNNPHPQPNMKNRSIYCALSLIALEVFFLTASCIAQTKALFVQSDDKLNKITLSLTADGKLSYNVTRRNKTIIADSPLGLNRDDQDFTSGLSVVEVSAVQKRENSMNLKWPIIKV